jgi:hypothetical protein
MEESAVQRILAQLDVANGGAGGSACRVCILADPRGFNKQGVAIQVAKAILATNYDGEDAAKSKHESGGDTLSPLLGGGGWLEPAGTTHAGATAWDFHADAALLTHVGAVVDCFLTAATKQLTLAHTRPQWVAGALAAWRSTCKAWHTVTVRPPFHN